MNNIAIIPARSGSKGLHDKNIKLLNNKPLLAYSIEAAIKSKKFSVVMVSTDSEYYANIAKKYGAEVPFLRSKKNSEDNASSWDTVEEVLVKYKDANKSFDTFMLLQPTSPLRTASDIMNAYDELVEKKANAIVSVCEVDHSPLQCNILPKSLSMDQFINKEYKGLRRQDMPIYYRFNGSIYLSTVESFLLTKDIYKSGCYAYVMSKQNSIDIDDEFDFAIAETLITLNNSI